MRTSMTELGALVLALLVVAGAHAWAQAPAPLPTTALPMRLVGVMRDTATPARSAALIRCGADEERRAAWPFVAGERVCDSAEIREVLAGGVVVLNLSTGRVEFLPLPGGTISQAPPQWADDGGSVAERPGPPPPLVFPAIDDTITVEVRQALIDASVANLAEVLNAALATPRTSGSGATATIDGYTISRITSGGLVDQLGLRDGDVLLAFNGQKLNSLGAVMTLFGQVQALSGSTLTVLRAGRTLTFRFVVR